MMSVVRQDPTTKEWVIIATDRGSRPDDFALEMPFKPTPVFEPGCPFCPGNEALTPEELWRTRDSTDRDWTIRVVANKFPALDSKADVSRREEGPLFREMSGGGSHEVIIETPVHNQTLSFMTIDHIQQVLEACQSRYRLLRKDPRVKSIVVFKNHGPRAGTSLLHPHWQLVATPVHPMLVRKKYEVAVSHYDDTGRCLYCDILAEEIQAGSRLLTETEEFVAFHPFASRLPYEISIFPKVRQSSFGQVEPPLLNDLAQVLRGTLGTLHRALGNPDYNLIIHSSPTDDESKDYFLWHLQILPRLSTIAGFELGSGIFINSMLPETCATLLRQSWTET